MSKTQTETGARIDGQPSRKVLEDEIKKYSRQFLTELFGAITPAKIDWFRDMLDNLADFLDDYSTQMRKSKVKGLGRPSGRLVKEACNCLTQYVGSDSAKWSEVKVWANACLDSLKQWPAAGESPQWTKDQFLKSISVLLRGKPGRHKKNVFTDAEALRRENPSKWSHSRLARRFWPNDFKDNPEKMRNRMKSGLSRYRKALNRTR